MNMILTWFERNSACCVRLTSCMTGRKVLADPRQTQSKSEARKSVKGLNQEGGVS